MRESRSLHEIRRLHPVRDAERIVYLDTCFEFPFDVTRSLELAFFRTFAVPSIAELLGSTGEFVERANKRYDDTDLLISAFAEHGHSSRLGRSVIRRMNQIHGRFPITNDDFLYVLSTMVLEPSRWNERFGWRRMLDTERLATFHFWRAAGGLMNIKDIPETYEELERFNLEFERSRFGYTDAGHRVARAMIEMFVRKVPGQPRRLGARGVCALLDEPLLDALDLPRPTAAERRAVEGALKLRATSVRLLPARRKPRLRTALRRRTYPQGYRIDDLGPPPPSTPLGTSPESG
ncbi:MAG: oxygenase MpaB family protein [Actinomycetota bacterium]